MLCLAIDYRTLADKSHLIYVAVLALLVYVLLFGAVRRRRAALDSARRSSTCSRRSSPRSRVALVLAKFFGESRRGSPSMTRPRDRRRASRCVPFAAHREAAGPRHGGDAPPDLPGHRLPRRHARCASSASCCSWPSSGRAGRVEVRAQGLSEEPHLDVPRSDAGRARRRLPADPGAHHASGRAGSGARGSCRGRRASCGSCRWPTTISSSRCWPRSRGSSASSWRSACTCS